MDILVHSRGYPTVRFVAVWDLTSRTAILTASPVGTWLVAKVARWHPKQGDQVADTKDLLRGGCARMVRPPGVSVKGPVSDPPFQRHPASGVTRQFLEGWVRKQYQSKHLRQT